MELLPLFAKKFGPAGIIRAFFAGGRVNIIGEHTDYNGGRVFPCALTLGTYCLIRERPGSLIRLYSENFPEAGVISCSVDSIEKSAAPVWSDYVTGMALMLRQAGYPLRRGFDMLVAGNLPAGAGLSSSASLEMAAGFAMNAVFGLGADNVTLAKLGQQTENGFIGVKTGIMDQFASAMGQENKAVYLDTASLMYELVPLELGAYGFLIMDTKKDRAFAGGKYNERCRECADALAAIRTKRDAPSLGALSPAEFEDAADAIRNETERKRARHAVYENERTKKAKAAMEAGDFPLLGRLMHESHASLRDDYEVSCAELDALVCAAESCEGVLGARMTGAGFGGCAVALVRKDCMAAVREKAGRAYRERFGREAAFYEAAAGGGPREVPSGTASL